MTNDAPFASRMHLRDGNNTLTYDAENRVVSASNGSSSGTYTFDGNSLRVKKVSGSTTTVYIFSGSKVVAEYDNGAAPSSPSREYIYSGGVLLAKIASGTSTYYQQDHLSNRLVTDSGGNLVAQMGHYPFGETWYNVSNDKLQFTNRVSGFVLANPDMRNERDMESSNDYAMMRSYVSRLARFSSPDPVAGSANDPQSLDAYLYVENDPVNFRDPKGLTPQSYMPALDAGTWNQWLFELYLNAVAGQLLVTSGEYSYTLISADANLWQLNNEPGLLGEVPWDVVQPSPNIGTTFPIAALKALALATNPECAKFLQSVGQSAILGTAGIQPGAPFPPTPAGEYVQSTFDNYSAAGVALTAFGANADNRPSEDPRDGNYHTVAEISRSAPNAIVTYEMFNEYVPRAQAQVLLHEATHLSALGASDQQLAAAAGVPNAMNMSTSRASSEFQSKLEKKCH